MATGSPAAPQRPAPFPVVRLRGVALHALTEAQCVRHVLDEIGAGRGGWIVTPNLDHLRRVLRDPSFASLYAKADLVVADGAPVVWATRIQGTPLPERVAGSNLVASLSAAAAERGRSIYLLGGAPGTAEASAEVLRRRHPKLRVAGVACPEPGFEEDERALAALGAALVAARPDIVFVALGSPKQERLVERFRNRLPAAWWLPIGVSLSFLAGEIRRAPRWMQRAGLEWVHRLAQEPRRLGKRYLVHGLPFAVSLLGGAVLARIARRDAR